MARPFPNTFEKESPMSPQSASNISYQTNVNRQKTKKWTEAKAVDYGGDDWGDDDEYDASPPPISKPTGFRQQGQGLQSPVKPESPAFDHSKKYGELPPLPPASDPRGRRNSFDADDEQRNFSNATIRQPSPAITSPSSAGPATRFSQITGVPSTRDASGPPALSIQTQQSQTPTGLRKPSQITSPIAESPHPDILRAGKVNTGETATASPSIQSASTASDFHARRDYSPSAVPSPLTARASPHPQTTNDTTATRFPGRKSSLSQAVAPSVAELTKSSAAETPTPKPWVAARSASPGAAAKSPIGGKALPFIRPADIYRRAEEERRQSLDSSRPSMDSEAGSRPSDIASSPQIREKSSSDSLGGAGRSRTSVEGDEGSDSGRRLQPILEPVRERKSEYGFEGINVTDEPSHVEPVARPETVTRAEPLAYAEPVTHTEPATHSHPGISQNIDEEGDDDDELRRLSTSPKLPNLTRISGFGIDMFSPTSSEHTKAEVSETPKAMALPPADEDSTLRTQPSFGSRSVVNQAFDRRDDNSVPPTPASTTDSDVRRTDSQSTGRTAISPIMGRIPSVATHSMDREATPTIPEVVHEPVSSEITSGNDDSHRGRAVPGFKTGYRRDISTPRSDNSPARTPDLAKAKIVTTGQHALVSEASPKEESEQDPLQPPRPTGDRSGSFRPAIPGGWTSYATSAQSEDRSEASASRAATPIQDIFHTPEQSHEESNITPTASRHVVPSSTVDTHTEASDLEPKSIISPADRSLPTPDPAMAPTGNLYSTTQLDPRLLPKLEQAPAETQLRPDAVDDAGSARSSMGPPPPLKDNVEDVSSKNLHSLPDIPSPPTDNYMSDDENDRLREEIVKSLTPRPSEGGSVLEEGMLADDFDEANYAKQGHESTYLPREYDNYWASTSDDHVDEPMPSSVAEPVKRPEVPQIQTAARDIQLQAESPVIAPLTPRRSQPPALAPPRPGLDSRFSWEASTDKVNLPSTDNDEVSEVSATSSPRHATRPAEDPTVPPPTTVAESIDRDQTPTGEILGQESTTSHDTNDLLAAAGAASLAAAALPVYNAAHQEPKSRRLSLAQEKDPRVSEHAVSPTPNEDEHPSRGANAYFSPTSDQHSPNPAASTASPVTSSHTQQQNMPPVGPLGPYPKFGDIVKMRTPEERIHEFDAVRQRYAMMDSGLSNWMATLKAQHASVGPLYGGAGSRTSMPDTARSRFGKATSGPAPSAQQPYYQQYLNASSPTNPSTPTRPGPGSSMASGSQGFSSNSGKLSTQQVQAKGKELLHTAGIFGGKAGKAGKGLLAKGKGRFRLGGDKTSSPPKPKNEQPTQQRRSSWGLPLSLSRSSGPSTPTKQSRDSFSQQRSRAPTTSSNLSTPVLQLPNVSTGDSLGMMDEPMPSLDNDISATHQESPSTRQTEQSKSTASHSEAQGSLAVPAPIGKHQPSWDPYTAAPISEEGSQHEEQPSERPLSPDLNTPKVASAVLLGDKAKSDRSNSDDTQFYSAHDEDPDQHDDWVLIHPNADSHEHVPASAVPAGPKRELKDVAPTAIPSQDIKAQPALSTEPEPRKKSFDLPITGIMNRPRGSSYGSPPPSAGLATPKASTPKPPPKTTSETAAAPLGRSAKQTKPLPAEPAEKSSSSFLPPIRRTSTFGFGFGPKTEKKRFALEDEDEQSLPENRFGNGNAGHEGAHQISSNAPGYTDQSSQSESNLVGPAGQGQYDNSSATQGQGQSGHLHFGRDAAAIGIAGAVGEGIHHHRENEEQRDFVPASDRAAETIAAPGSVASAPMQQSEGRRLVAGPAVPSETAPEKPIQVQQQPEHQNVVASTPVPSSTASERTARIQQQTPVVEETLQKQRPLSFTTARAQEVLNTPSKPENRTAVTSLPGPDLTTSNEPEQLSREPINHQQIQKPCGASIHQVPLQTSGPMPNAGQSAPSDYSQQSDQGQRTVLAQPTPQQNSVMSSSSDKMYEAGHEARAVSPPRSPPTSQHPQLPPLVTPRANDVLQRPEFRESQVEWRPNRQKAPEPNPVDSPSFWKDVGIQSQRQRTYSGSSPSYSGRPDGQYTDRSWVASPSTQTAYPQPPSSAQKYPDLFRPGQSATGEKVDADLPAHYYQAPISKADAFLPRQQTNEYQIPGVGPPADDPRNNPSRRNSGFFKEIGGKLSRASSRNRSDSRATESGPPSPVRQSESLGDYADSIHTTDAERDQRRRRSSFFGHLSRTSTSALDPPRSRESVVAHNSASRPDLLASGQASPVQQERKRSFFGGGSKDKEPKVKPKKLVRSSTGNGAVKTPEKKNRFSGLSSMFSSKPDQSRESVQERPQATRELSYHERQPIDSPQMERNGFVAQTPPPSQGGRGQSQTRQVLQKLTSSPSPRSSPRAESKTRRASGAGLLGGLMGRRSHQQERGSDDSRSQGSSQPGANPPQMVPAAQTHSDLLRSEELSHPVTSQHAQQPQHRRDIPFQDQSVGHDRRSVDRGPQNVAREPEPRYDSVPIPGVYSLVRGQGATATNTQYDPRLLNNMPRQQQHTGPKSYNGQYANGGQMQTPQYDARQTSPPQQQPHDPRTLLQPVPSHTHQTARRSLSREDLIARSPPKSLEGQQRPYQISLPGDDNDEEEDRPSAPISKDTPTLKHDHIQRLQPTLRHPESPAGYPLPEDTVFSPVNPGVNDIPSPPLPAWPDHGHLHAGNVEGDLDRSNTHRTAVSAVSGISPPHTGGLNVPSRQISDPNERRMSHCPTPPSPLPGTRTPTPERLSAEPSHAHQGNTLGIKTTEIERTLGEKRSEGDLYNASPKRVGPREGLLLPRELTGPNTTNGHQAQLQPQMNGKENSHPVSQESGMVAGGQEEKIPFQEKEGIAGRVELPARRDDDEPEMSAVSYPGMEWNPYAAGAWDNGYD